VATGLYKATAKRLSSTKSIGHFRGLLRAIDA
jgi:hypothetical protein